MCMREIILALGQLWRSVHMVKCYPGKSGYSALSTWWSGYCYWNKRECGLNQSRVDSFVGRVAKNNSQNDSDRHKIHEIFLANCLVLVITLLWQIVHSSLMTQTLANLMENKLWLFCGKSSCFSWFSKETLSPLRYLENFIPQITKQPVTHILIFSRGNEKVMWTATSVRPWTPWEGGGTSVCLYGIHGICCFSGYHFSA